MKSLFISKFDFEKLLRTLFNENRTLKIYQSLFLTEIGLQNVFYLFLIEIECYL